MKWFQRILLIFLMLAVLLAESAISKETLYANHNGNYSDVCGVITEETESWVLSNFGQYANLEQLLFAIEDFAFENFTYSSDGLLISQRILQHFDMQQFIKSDFQGVCFDFSCFCKNVVLIWSESRGEAVQCFVDEVYISFSNAHAYNYFVDSQGNTWYLDLTADNTCYKNGDMQNIWGPLNLGDMTVKAFDRVLYPDGYMFSLLR